MNTNELIRKNINNLTSLFQLMGAKKEILKNGNTIQLSNAWPNRIWMPYDYQTQDLEQTINLVSQKEKQYVLSLWEYDEELFHKTVKILEEKKYKVLFEQIGMSLDLKRVKDVESNDLDIKFAIKQKDIELWVKIASDSFSTSIDKNVIENISKNKNVYLLLGYKDEKAVATTLLYKTNSVIGVHLVGVPSKYRGQGIAENIMKKAISFSKEQNTEVMTLQASTLGLNIYKRLGFKEEFLLRNYAK